LISTALARRFGSRLLCLDDEAVAFGSLTHCSMLAGCGGSMTAFGLSRLSSPGSLPISTLSA
jgi:hypothetical protein